MQSGRAVRNDRFFCCYKNRAIIRRYPSTHPSSALAFSSTRQINMPSLSKKSALPSYFAAVLRMLSAPIPSWSFARGSPSRNRTCPSYVFRQSKRRMLPFFCARISVLCSSAVRQPLKAFSSIFASTETRSTDEMPEISRRCTQILKSMPFCSAFF